MLRYLISKEFWLTILGLIALGVLSFVLLFYVFLPGYTLHGESVIVPELARLSVDEAEGALEALDLKYEVADSVYLPDAKPRSVVAHDPPAMSKVKPGRRIYLTINKSRPPIVKFPEIKSISFYQAKLKLEPKGITVHKILYEPHELRDVVLRAETMDGEVLEKDMEVEVGSRVVLIVAMGLGNQKIEVPDLVGMKYDNAVTQLRLLSMDIGAPNFKPESEEEQGTVVRQDPPFFPGDSVIVGTTFVLFVAGEEPEISDEEPISEDDMSSD